MAQIPPGMDKDIGFLKWLPAAINVWVWKPWQQGSTNDLSYRQINRPKYQERKEGAKEQWRKKMSDG